LTDFGDNIMLQIIDFDHVYDFGLIQSKIIVSSASDEQVESLAK